MNWNEELKAWAKVVVILLALIGIVTVIAIIKVGI